MPNESLIHADIFFFISTIALVLISAGICVALFYAIRILRDVREFSDLAKAEGVELLADLKKLRANLRDEGIKWKHVAGLVRTFFVSKAPAKKKVQVKND
jgi:hypothetical protein